MDIISASTSAIGIASHNPSTPMTRGRRIIAPAMKTKVLINDISADIFPFDSAVNIDEAKILKPENRNVTENNKYALIASPYVSLLLGMKIETTSCANTRDITNIVTVDTIIILILFLNILCS